LIRVYPSHRFQWKRLEEYAQFLFGPNVIHIIAVNKYGYLINKTRLLLIPTNIPTDASCLKG
jgi:hypothetical protein